jgi:Domain of Unknown Function (DUF1080)
MNTMRRSDPRHGLFTSFGAIRRALPLAAACAGLIATAMAAGQSPAPKDQPGGAPKKIVLFDGKTLDGWKKTDFYHAGEVKVEDGRIILAAGASATGITTTRQDLPRTNYELTYEAMRTGGVDFFAAATFPVGSSYITLINGGWGGHVTGLSSLNGMDASENETTNSFKYEDKTWYRFRVRVTGAVIRCWVGDKEVVAVNHEEKRVGTRVESRSSEPLGFATWKTGGALRDIEVRPLTPDEIAATNKIE